MPEARQTPIRLDASQQRDFFERGWVLLPDVFTPGEIDEMRGAFERLERTARALQGTGEHRGARFVLESADAAGSGRRPRIHRVVWCGGAEPVLARYGRDVRLLRPAAQLLGSDELNQLINQAHFKLPGDGVAFPWHQDSSHRRYGGEEWRDVNGHGSYVQTVTAIDDVTDSNGPLLFVPGSGRQGHVTLPDDGVAGLSREVLDPSLAVAPTMRSGSVLLFGPYVFHSSEPNRSDRPRRVLINGFAYPGANSRVYPGAGAGHPIHLPR